MLKLRVHRNVLKKWSRTRSDFLPPGTPVRRDGMYQFLHLVRAKDDPKETIKRGCKEGDPVGWKSLLKVPVEEWKQRIHQHMSDGQPRTFNRMMVEICGRTADVCFDKPPDWALWELVEAGTLIHTNKIPIYFKVPDER